MKKLLIWLLLLPMALLAQPSSNFGTVNITGTAGAGYLQLGEQSSAPGTPTNAARIYVDSTNRLSWKGEDGFSRTFGAATNTASRVYTFPDAATSIPVYGQTITYSGPTAARTVTYPDANFTAARTDAAQTFTGTQTFSTGIIAETLNVTSASSPTVAYIQTTNATSAPGTLLRFWSTSASGANSRNWSFGHNVTAQGDFVFARSTTNSGSSTTAVWSSDKDGNMAFAGTLTFSGTSSITSASGQALVLATGTFGNSVSFASATGIPTFLSTVDASALGTASVVLSGGLSVAKRLIVQDGTISANRVSAFGWNQDAGSGIDMRNSNTGTGSYSFYSLTNNGGSLLTIYQFAPTYTTSNRFIQDSTLFEGGGAGGVNFSASNAAGAFKWYTNGNTVAMSLTTAGNLTTTGTLTTTGGTFLHATSSALTAGATGNVPTLTAGPVTGNPTKWIAINDNGTTRYIPTW